ncbi:hypothetical protein [Paraliomyxa miuraensis]|uniref:hypothetical protein n=1 Tax=Paraliomyxa miuraensis TaxID=376150 RepID=UPI00224E3F05|nr:hypothetical protein [Paraliomyxa miuraensis]MCX4247754.1 hypothetical protein [Paraliomyxa miuraensis]
MGCDTPRPCNFNVIGANTLGTTGINPGQARPLNVTAGDAGKFTPKFYYFEALPYNDEQTVDITLLPASRDSPSPRAKLDRYGCARFARRSRPQALTRRGQARERP